MEDTTTNTAYILRVNDKIIGWHHDIQILNERLLSMADQLKQKALKEHRSKIYLDFSANNKSGVTMRQAVINHVCWSGTNVLHTLWIEPLSNIEDICCETEQEDVTQ